MGNGESGVGSRELGIGNWEWELGRVFFRSLCIKSYQVLIPDSLFPFRINHIFTAQIKMLYVRDRYYRTSMASKSSASFNSENTGKY